VPALIARLMVLRMANFLQMHFHGAFGDGQRIRAICLLLRPPASSRAMSISRVS
jgi:hypothetical protein